MNKNLGPQFEEAAGRLKGPEEGFTLNPRSGAFATGGWAVGGAGAAERSKDVERVTGRTVGAYARMEQGPLQAPGAHIGGWRYQGKGYLDVSTVEPDLHRAIGLMGVRGEKAIYNLNSGQTYWNQRQFPLKFSAIPAEKRKTRKFRRIS